MATMKQSALSQLLGLRDDLSTGGGLSLIQQVNEKTDEDNRRAGARYMAGADLSQMSALSQWMAKQGF